ncbi:hypothetical protein C4K00_3722 [Pseudomonas synxantha]|nr:hypothetical protein C4K00_3722 [Pseudomonas synxantha]
MFTDRVEVMHELVLFFACVVPDDALKVLKIGGAYHWLGISFASG